MSTPFYIVTTQSGQTLTVDVMAKAGTNAETADVTFAAPASETYVSAVGPAGWTTVANGSTSQISLADFSFNAPVGAGTDARLLRLTFTLASVSTVPSGTVTVTDYSDMAGNSYGSSGAMPLAGSAACFAAGTRLRAVAGDMAVEQLRLGQQMVLADGGTAPIVWIGHRHLDTARHPRPWDVQPVRVRAHAIAADVPCRDLVLSPDHALFLDGVLVPVRYLLNGTSIVQEDTRHVTYFHVELDRHAILLAEGVAAESYLDTGNRDAFGDDGVAMLHPDFAATGPAAAAAIWQASACAPLVTSGDAVDALRTRFAARACRQGWSISADPMPRVTIDGHTHFPHHTDGGLSLKLPVGARMLTLHSNAASPSHMRPGERDDRALGLCVTGLVIDGVAISLDDARLATGWHGLEPGLRWTNGRAQIDVRRCDTLSVTWSNGMTYWAAPPARIVA